MKICRLKIITASINPDKNESDAEIIHYVSQNKNSSQQYEINSKEIEEEKNININLKNEEEEDAIIIRDKNDLIKPKKPTGKVYLINGLFAKNNKNPKKRIYLTKSADISNSKNNKYSENQKLRSTKKNILGNSKNGKKPTSNYKFGNNQDNKINNIYNSKKVSNLATPNKGDGEKFFSAPENPFAFDFYHTNKKIDSNIARLFDCKKKIQELLDDEPKKMEERDKIVQENDKIIQKLLLQNTNLNYELGFEINREDELKGEIIILRNQHEILLNLLGQEEKKIKQYQDIIKHKIDHEKTRSNRQNEIINYYNNLNECLTKGEVLLVTKPDLYNKFTYINSKNIENNNIDENSKDKDKEENGNNENNEINKDKDNDIEKVLDNNKDGIKNENMNIETNLEVIKEIDINNELDNYLHYDIITLLLKGYFINMNLTNIDDIINKIWLKEKPLQTFESLTEELLLIIDNYINNPTSTFINEHNRNIIMNYFYTFCNSYNYMTINEFRSIFNNYIGYFIEYNENYLINKLYKFCNGKLSEFIKVIKDLDVNKTGKIDIHEFIKALKEKNLIFNRNKEEKMNSLELNNIIEILQLLIIDMKRNKLAFEEKDAIPEENKNKISIYELYYEGVVKIIKDNKNNKIPLYKGIIKKYLVDNNINSMIDFLNPLLLNHDIIINKGLNRYLKNQTYNDFLISNKVIGENEIFLLPYKEESLIEINQLVADIDQAKPLLSEFEENKEKLINDIFNDISDS
jgi:hypothetical protein